MSTMFNNIMSAFTGTGEGKQPGQKPTGQVKPVNDGMQSLDPNAGQQQQKKEPSDPLAAFEKIFDNTPDKDAPKAPSFKLTPEVLKQASESLDFSDVVPQDFRERFDKNDPSAMSDLVNGLARKLYSTTLDHSSILTDRFVGQRSEHDRRGLGSEVTKTLAKNNLKSIASKSPVAAKQIEQIHDAIIAKNPDATPEFVQEQTEEYFRQIALVMFPELAELNPAAQKKKQQSAELTGNTDWDKYF